MILKYNKYIKDKLLTTKMLDSHDFNKKIKNNVYANFITDYNHKESTRVMKEDYDEKISEFKKTPEKLMIVTDFDFTLTKKYFEETHLYSSYCVLEKSEFISDNFKQKNQELFVKYSKYENDLTIDFSTKDQLIRRWFQENLELILEENIKKESFLAMILQAEKNFYYRYGISEFFDLIEKHNIPIFIISGGIQEIIEESLNHVLPQYSTLKNKNLIHVIANKFKYDENNKVIGYVEPFVYTFNKGETLKRIFKEYNTGDENIIVMGDHINDIDTIKHLDYNNEIKIGFINFEEDSEDERKMKLLEAYQLRYDVLIFNDGNLNFVNNLLRNILKGSTSLKIEKGDKNI
jgi:HAD superfamily hydrolase (TIGR01544 family)